MGVWECCSGQKREAVAMGGRGGRINYDRMS